ncbi:Tuberous sclerosis 2-like protein [Globomyces sp. JEL0801]|nr:Tuberous sclerosis 2-like protein [Globomyces sp. JEL0801]
MSNIKELLKLLDLPNTTIANQSSLLLQINSHCKSISVPSQQLVAIWAKVKPFTTGQLRPEAYDFIHCCLSHHFNECDLLRLDFFNVISVGTDAIPSKLSILKLLTKEARDIRHLEHTLAALLATWLSIKKSIECQSDLLSFITNFVKFSFVYLDQSSIADLMNGAYTCFLVPELRYSALNFLDGLLRFGVIPKDLIPLFTKQLCIAITEPSVESFAWNTVNNALHSHISHHVVNAAINLIYQSNDENSHRAIVGAIHLFSSIYTKQSYELYGSLLVLKAFVHASKTKDFNIALSTLSASLKIASNQKEWIEYDLLVDVFDNCSWIWNQSHIQFNVTIENSVMTPLTEEEDKKINLLTKYLTSLVRLANHLSAEMIEFILKESGTIIWADKVLYLLFFEELISNTFYNARFSTEIRIKVLESFIQLKSMELIRSDLDTTMDRIERHILGCIYVQLPTPFATRFLNWLIDSIADFQLSDIEFIIDSLVCSCLNIKPTQNFDMKFFDDPVKNNKVVKNLENPYLSHPESFSKGELNIEQCLLNLMVLLKLSDKFLHQDDLFHLGLQIIQLNSIGVRIYQWVGRIFSWNTVGDIAIRSLALSFLSKFSCNCNGQITYSRISSRLEDSTIEWETVTLSSRVTFGSVSPQTEEYHFPIHNSIYSYIATIKFESNHILLMDTLKALPEFLQNKLVWIHSPTHLKIFCEAINDLILTESAGKLLVDVPLTLRKYDIYLLLYKSLVTLFLYKSLLPKSLQDTLPKTLVFGVGKWPPIAKYCIQGLVVALYEMPQSITRHLSAIVMKISQVTSSNLALSNLEFLASLAYVPELCVNFTIDDYKTIFGIAFTYLRQSGPQSAQVTTLAFYVTQIWFLSLKIQERKKYVPMIISTLLSANSDQKQDTLDESTELVLDLLVQHTFIDSAPKPSFQQWTPNLKKKGVKTWCYGNTLISIDATDFGNEIVFRRPTGITVWRGNIMNDIGKMDHTSQQQIFGNNPKSKHLFLLTSEDKSARSRSVSTDSMMVTDLSPAIDQPLNQNITPHNLSRAKSISLESKVSNIGVGNPATSDTVKSELPNHIDPTFLLLLFQPFPLYGQLESSPRILPDDDATIRALSVLDRTPSIDLHKIGVVFVDLNQKTESEILGNLSGSISYSLFLSSLGNFIPLCNNRDIYTGGLDTSPDTIDGPNALCYIPDERMSQVIFHVTTIMPNNPNDLLRTAKKRHIGNDFVTIVWNESGETYNPETIPGQFNLIQIVIEPVSGNDYNDCGFLVTMCFRPDIPIVAPSPIVINGSILAPFVRHISIFCNLLAQVFTSGEASSNAKERLRQIKRVRKRIDTSVAGGLDFTFLG